MGWLSLRVSMHLGPGIVGIQAKCKSYVMSFLFGLAKQATWLTRYSRLHCIINSWWASDTHWVVEYGFKVFSVTLQRLSSLTDRAICNYIWERRWGWRGHISPCLYNDSDWKLTNDILWQRHVYHNVPTLLEHFSKECYSFNNPFLQHYMW